MFDKAKEYFRDGKPIEGRNMDAISSAKFTMLSDAKFEGVEFSNEQVELLKRLESKLSEVFDLESGVEISPLGYKVSENGVEVEEGTVFHRCKASMDTLRGIGNCGVLASEWFGRLESEGEARFCAFLNQRRKYVNPLFDNENIKASRLNAFSVDECVLYFDQNNPELQELIKMDYFEYEHLKKTNPEELQARYSQGIIELFEKIISPLSPSGKKFHDKESVTSNWMAIPGGIPAKFINGICISSKNEELNNEIIEITSLFPNAIIFNEKGEILANPLISQKDEEKKSE